MRPEKITILFVEDDLRYRERNRRNLEIEGYNLLTASNGGEALEILAREDIDLVLTDIKMPGMDGLELIRRIRNSEEPNVDGDVPIVVLSSIDDSRTVRDAMRSRGAEDYVLKEEDLDALLITLSNTLEKRRIKMENVLLREELSQWRDFGEIVAVSSAMDQVMREVESLAPAEVTVLITGESGVGKELVARAIHGKSPRSDRPLVAVDCPTMAGDNLSLSELFGHEKGAYTGATDRRKGKFELAHKSTLFLDEIGDLPPDTQAKILRSLETREVERLGGSRSIRVDVRLVCATNKNLLQEIRAGRFRQDLYHRIHVAEINIPPLRERKDDITPLAEHFLDVLSRKYGRPPKVFSSGALDLLIEQPWPGNVRELRHLIEGLIFKVSGSTIEADDLRSALPPVAPLAKGDFWGILTPPGSVVSLPESGIPLEEIERQAVLQALERAAWVQKEAAALLESRPTR
jgi:DNA-binding NtrC family response regulator